MSSASSFLHPGFGSPGRAVALALFALSALAPAAHVSAAPAPVVFNEILAANHAAVPVGSRFPDYVELINTTEASVPLAGATLADDSVTSLPFRFPAGTSLAPRARLVVWCDQVPGLPAPQALLGIGATGERLRLTAPDGTVWDEVTFGLQPADLGLGRVPEGTGSWQPIAPSPGAANAPVTLSPPTSLRINEWMASPATGDDWIELHNPATRAVDLSGLILTDRSAVPSANRPIPALSFIGPGGFIQFFASDLRRPDADHLDFRLGAGGDQIILLAADRSTVLDRVTFGPQQSATSQGRAPDGSESIADFPPGQATPGARNLRELTRVVISEILSHTDPPFEDAIELHNPGASTVDISHWWLSDDASEPKKFRLPAGSLIPAGGYLAVYEGAFGAGPAGFSLNSYEGDDVWLSTGDAAGYLTGERASVRFGALPNAIPVGRVGTSFGADFAPLTRPTFGVDFPASLAQFRQGRGASNATPRLSPVQIAEIHSSPPQGAPGGRTEAYLELVNPTTSPAPLYDPLNPTNAWRIRGAVRFDFPTGVVLSAGERLLVTALDPAKEIERLARFRQAHRIPTHIPVFGPFSGSLDQPTAGLELQYPDLPEGPTKPRPGFVPYVRAERVDYHLVPPWPTPDAQQELAWLRRESPSGDFSNDPAAWILGPPSPGLAQPNPEALDADADGLPDAWESLHQLDPLSAADADDDPDTDGAVNLDEYLAGTAPRDPADVLRLRAVASPEVGMVTSIRLRFPTKAGKSYRVESRDPANGPWETAAEVPASAESGEFERTIPTPSAARWFRIRLVEVP